MGEGSMAKRLIKIFALGFVSYWAAYFVYWQGFYRGADTQLCVAHYFEDPVRYREVPWCKSARAGTLHLRWRDTP